MAKQPPDHSGPSPQDKNKKSKPSDSTVDLGLPAFEAAQASDPSEVSQKGNWADIVSEGRGASGGRESPVEEGSVQLDAPSDADLLMQDLQESAGGEQIPLAQPVSGAIPLAHPVPPPAGPDEEDALAADMEEVRRLFEADNPPEKVPPRLQAGEPVLDLDALAAAEAAGVEEAAPSGVPPEEVPILDLDALASEPDLVAEPVEVSASDSTIDLAALLDEVEVVSGTEELAVAEVDATNPEEIVDLGAEALVTESGVIDLGMDAVEDVPPPASSTGRERGSASTTDDSAVIDLGMDAVEDVAASSSVRSTGREGESGLLDLGAVEVVEEPTPGSAGSGVIDLGAGAVIEVPVVGTGKSGVIVGGVEVVAKKRPVPDKTGDSGVIDLDDVEVVEEASPSGAGESGVLDLGAVEVVEDASPSGESGVLDLGALEVVEDASPSPSGESGVLDLGAVEVIEDAAPSSGDSDVIDVGAMEVIEDTAAAAAASSESGLLDLGAVEIVEDAAPASGASGVVDLDVEQMAADEPGSDVPIGREARPHSTGSSRDLIAEAVESGIDLDMSPMELNPADQAADLPLETVGKKSGPSSIDLGSKPDMEISPSDARAGVKPTPSSSSGVTADAEEPDLEALLSGDATLGAGDSASAVRLGTEGEDELLDLTMEAGEPHEEIDLGMMSGRAHQPSASAIPPGTADIDLAAMMASEASGASEPRVAAPGKSKGTLDIDADEVDLGAADPTSSDALNKAAAEEAEIDLGALETTADLGSGMALEDKPPASDVPIEEEAVVEDEVETEDEGEEEEEEKGKKKPAKARSSAGAWVGGTVLGTLVGAGACFALIYFDVVPDLKPPKASLPITRPPIVTPPGPQVTAADHLKNGDLNKIEEKDFLQPQQVAAKAQVRWEKYLQAQKRDDKPINVADEPVKTAEEEVKKSDTADALFELGQIQELTGRVKEAEATYKAGLEKFKADRRFEAGLLRLEARPAAKGPQGEAQGRLPTPQIDEAAVLALLLVALQDPKQPDPKQPDPKQPDPKQPDPKQPGQPGPDQKDLEEAGFKFWQAAKLATQQKYAEAIKLLDEARKLHERRRFIHLRKPQNPVSDPNEEIFLRSCDELKLCWELQEKLRGGGYLTAGKDPAKALDLVLTENKDARTAREALVTKLTEEKVITKPEDADKGITTLLAEHKAREALVKKLADEKVITKPEDADKGIDTLLTEHKAREALVKKMTEEKLITKPEDADKTLDTLVTERKADQAKLADLDKQVKDKTKELDERNDQVKKVVQELVDSKYLDKPDNALVVSGVKDVVKIANMKDPKGELRKLQQDLTQQDDRRLKEVAAKEDQRKKEVAEIKDRMDKEITKLTTERDKDVGSLKDQLKLRRPASEMLGVWLPLLDEADKDLSTRAVADAQIVLGDPMAAPEAKAHAKVVQGLALRNLEKFTEAKTALVEAKTSLPANDAQWAAPAEAGLKEVSNPPAYFVARAADLQSRGKVKEALGVLDRGVQALPEDNAALLAQRSLLHLEQARAAAVDGKVAANNPALGKARKDALEAVMKTMGKDDKKTLALGYYAAGRTQEETGDWADALDSYRAALKEHATTDALGSRLRMALARVLVQPRQGRPAVQPDKPVPPAPPPNEKGKDIEKDKDKDAKMSRLPTVAEVLRLAADPQTEKQAHELMVVLLTVALQAPEPFVSPTRQEALKLADEIIRLAEDPLTPKGTVPFDALAQAYVIKGLWTRALTTYAKGLKTHLRPEYYEGLMTIVRNHPQLRRPDSLKPPNPFEAESRYATGLRFYFGRNYGEAEKNFEAATHFDNQDARYFYFLGLTRLMLGKTEAAEDFEQGTKLEKQNRPNSNQINTALERVQGPVRRVLNEARSSLR